MTEEVLIPKMKRLDKKQRKFKIPINNFVLVILCTLLIICATFVNIELKHYIIPAGFSLNNNYSNEDFIYAFSIIPQIPALMFVCSLLGKKLALTCTYLYVILGIFALPVFALGGGIGYIAEYSFGYILAFIAGAYICTFFLEKKYSFVNMILGAILGVCAIHLCGVLYMSVLALIKQEGIKFIQSWISNQSGLKIVYDMALSFIGILIGKYIHSFLQFLSD